MTEEVFKVFWENSSKEWYENARIKISSQGASTPVKNYCTIKPNVNKILFKRYEAIKGLIKDAYFKKPEEKKLSCYKRAAVIAQVILLTNPLDYYDPDREGLDPLFLKQRLAFCVALDSITQAFPADKVDSLSKPLYHFNKLDTNCQGEDDSFLMSVYKDMFFSELYENYNVLTMANVFGLLTERVSELQIITQAKGEN